MFAKMSIALLVFIAIFLGYVATRQSTFRYERSGVINAPADKIYPYISNLKMGDLWNPYDKKDANMKKTFTGTDGQVGSTMEFEGNNDVGAGKLELLKLVPNELVEIRLLMTKPMQADNLVQYTLTPEGEGTRFTWAMSGDGGFMTKLIGVFIDCEKMVAGDFEAGVANLKAVVEAHK